MKKLSSFNKLLKDYQPLIQTVGIIIIVISFFAVIWQIKLSKDSLTLSKEQFNNDLFPKWKTEIVWDKENALKDELILSSSNLDCNIQKIKLTIVNKATPTEIEMYKTSFSTDFLKNEIIEIINEFYSINDSDQLTTSQDFAYPIALTYYYEQLGKKKESTVLYEYVFKEYVSYGKSKIKTIGLEYQNILENGSNNLINELIDFNLKKSFLSKCDCSCIECLVKSDKIKQDTLISPLFEFATLNLKISSQTTIFKSKKTNSNLFEITILTPAIIDDSSLNCNSLELIKRIESYRNYYDDEIIYTYDSIISKKSFWEQNKKNFSVSNDSLKINKRATAFEQEINEWSRLNRSLIKILYSHIK